MFTKRDNKVFHYDVEVTGANVATFGALNNTWGKDDKKVFCRSGIKRVEDVSTFEALNECYARDKFHVYLPAVNFEKADAASFVVLDAGTTPTSLVLSDIHHLGGYAKDKNCVYYMNVIVKDADPMSFQSLRNRFGMDSKNVYYEGKNLHVKDVASWRPIEGDLSCDRFAVYFCNRLVKSADPRTIWLLLPKGQNYFRDHAAFYCNDFVISSEDYYKRLEEDISHYTGVLQLFRKGDYFSNMFRRSVPMDAPISDKGKEPSSSP